MREMDIAKNAITGRCHQVEPGGIAKGAGHQVIRVTGVPERVSHIRVCMALEGHAQAWKQSRITFRALKVPGRNRRG